MYTAPSVSSGTDDFTSQSTTLTFDRCVSRACVSIPIENDEKLEMTESFNVTLMKPPTVDNRISLGSVKGVVEITDNDRMF